MEVCKFKEEVAECFSSVSILGVHTTKFRSLDHLVEKTGRFGEISVMYASVYD